MFNSTSLFEAVLHCYSQKSSLNLFLCYILINVPFILPVCIYILSLGVQRYRSRAQISHSDFFTYNMVLTQLIGILGSCLLFVNYFIRDRNTTRVTIYMFYFNYIAIIVYQILTCLERYVAVIHPVFYRNLKSRKWVIIRNLSNVAVWLLSMIFSIYICVVPKIKQYMIISFTTLPICVVLVLFGNLRILHVLMRPGPGDGAKGNSSKQRTLHTIMIITGALLVKFSGDMVSVGSLVHFRITDESCALYFSPMWFGLPSQLVLPLLFLQRNGKCLCFRTKK